MTYATILMDPPWPERGGGKIKRGADKHYPLISRREDIARVILQSPKWQPATSAHLYMWATNNYMPWAFWLIDTLGFRYITGLPWGKEKFGIGQYWRGQHETCLFAVKGKGYDVCTTNAEGQRIAAGKTMTTTAMLNLPRDRSEHSAKPFRQYEVIERRSIGPYLEMFARVSAPGWDAWGLEAEERLTDKEKREVAACQ